MDPIKRVDAVTKIERCSMVLPAVADAEGVLEAREVSEMQWVETATVLPIRDCTELKPSDPPEETHTMVTEIDPVEGELDLMLRVGASVVIKRAKVATS